MVMVVVGEGGVVQQMSKERERNTHRYAETLILYITEAAEGHPPSPTHTHLLGCMHADVNTRADLIKHARKHAHTHTPASVSHCLSCCLTSPASPLGNHLDRVLSVATMQISLWEKLLLMAICFSRSAFEK